MKNLSIEFARTAALLLISYLACTLAINGLAHGLTAVNDRIEGREVEVSH